MILKSIWSHIIQKFKESTLGLLLLLPIAVLRRLVERSSKSTRETIVTICGLIALVSPLAFWIVWSKTIFYIVLGTTLGAFVVMMILIWLSPDEYY